MAEKTRSLNPKRLQVIAVPDTAKTQSEGGILLAEQGAEKPKTAVVVAVGPEVIGIEVGERICYRAYAADEIKLDGKDYLIIDEDDVIAGVVEG